MRTTCAAIALSLLFAACSREIPWESDEEDDALQEQAGAVKHLTAPVAPAGPLARSAVIQEVAIFQGTRVAVEQNGTRVARKMAVIEGRDALVRAYLTPQGAPTGKPITGELYVVQGGKIVSLLKDTVAATGPSREEAPETVFDFEVPGAQITADTYFAVRLLEDGQPVVPPSTVSPAQYPANGIPESIGAEKSTDKLKVVVVPVRYTGDGTMRLPDIGVNVLDAIKQRMLEYYPVPNVEVTLHAPVDFAQPILGDGTGWDAILAQITQLRLAENAPPDVYYYAGFAPAATLRDFCSSQCVLGLSNSANDIADVTQRVSVGVLFASNDSIDTVPHEIGHAHGRKHAPCGNAGGVDPAYPYPNGIIQSWGYSIATKSLKPPNFFDQMSYCTPAWQSDYTYAALLERIRAVVGLSAPHAPGSPVGTTPPRPARTYRMLRIGADGKVAWAGVPFETSSVVSGERQSVSFVNESGTVVADEEAHAFGFDHLPGGTLIVPYEKASHARMRMRWNVTSAEESAKTLIAPVRRRFGERVEIPLE